MNAENKKRLEDPLPLSAVVGDVVAVLHDTGSFPAISEPDDVPPTLESAITVAERKVWGLLRKQAQGVEVSSQLEAALLELEELRGFYAASQQDNP